MLLFSGALFIMMAGTIRAVTILTVSNHIRNTARDILY
jgi:hypothetical protein